MGLVRAALSWAAQRRWRILISLLLVAVAAWLGGPHLWAWHHFRAGRTALDRYHANEARDHFNACLKVWPNNIETLLLASRAARRAGEFEEARSLLRECQRLQETPSDETVLERSLLHAASGDLDEVEGYLLSRAEKDPALAPLVWEALAVGCARVYRIIDANLILEEWLKHEPDNVQALFLRGEVRRQVGAAEQADEDYQRVLQLDPTRDDARRWLVRGLLRMGRYAEAQMHTEELLRRKPGDADLLVDLARAKSEQGKRDEARAVLDSVLADHPDHGRALRERGRLALRQDRPAEAEEWLRKAIQGLPQDFSANWDLAEALKQQDKTIEADEQRNRARAIQDRMERLAEIGQRQMSHRPRDPALHCELGVLLITMDRKGVGESWLNSALRLDPTYRPAHAALADLYQEQGDAEKAAYHRKQAEDNTPAAKP
jgi:tetratricopeptide (TPR) repeat protein